ncbi:hypothetical protein DQ04_00971060 [Trypanosoma grayi]|uniref:hypothetical protein n=1 Tax=Trypanosoma grayi TaxID=71804 RepID=UPI0004F45DA2|nr:hypothetical protein DQ04_00971060 [Trypanosoma grayi]KEG13496.1 hypothetical protein DQ04_00971060 [Trypanosoma grayi]
MEPPAGISEHTGEGQRNVRQRVHTPAPPVTHEGERQQQRPSTPEWRREFASPRSTPLEKITAKGHFFIVTEKKVVCDMKQGVQPSLLDDESQRCWEEHRASGRMHHEPPWRVCSLAEDNREHPYYMQWLDTMELPPLEELLRKESSNGITADNSSLGEEKKGAIEADNASDVVHQQQQQQQQQQQSVS